MITDALIALVGCPGWFWQSVLTRLGCALFHPSSMKDYHWEGVWDIYRIAVCRKCGEKR